MHSDPRIWLAFAFAVCWTPVGAQSEFPKWEALIRASGAKVE